MAALFQSYLSDVAALELALLADGDVLREDYGAEEHCGAEPRGEHFPGFALSLRGCCSQNFFSLISWCVRGRCSCGLLERLRVGLLVDLVGVLEGARDGLHVALDRPAKSKPWILYWTADLEQSFREFGL